jgi:hypothetical protein
MKGQTRLHSLLESVINILIGFAINLIANILVLPLFGFHVTVGQAFNIGLIFTGISIIRGYFIRRFFNRIMVTIHLRKEVQNGTK